MAATIPMVNIKVKVTTTENEQQDSIESEKSGSSNDIIKKLTAGSTLVGTLMGRVFGPAAVDGIVRAIVERSIGGGLGKIAGDIAGPAIVNYLGNGIVAFSAGASVLTVLTAYGLFRVFYSFAYDSKSESTEPTDSANENESQTVDMEGIEFTMIGSEGISKEPQTDKEVELLITIDCIEKAPAAA